MVIFDKNKICIFFLFLSIVAGLVLRVPKKNIPRHNTLKTDYVKVTITWEPPNNAPTFSAGPAESPASTAASPTNVGTAVNFYATGTDPDGNNYYLAICQSNSITPNANGAPTCDGGAWCRSGSTASGAQATCSTTTLAAWDTSNPWYGFICDHNASSLCSSMGQGSGASGSPFEVNHRPQDPNCGAWPGGSGNPGATITIGATVYGMDSDGDNTNMYVCKTNNTSGTGCEADQELCHHDSCGTDCSCDATAPVPGEGSINYYIFTFDERGLRSTNSCTDHITVNNVAPANSSLSLNGGGDIDVSTGGEGPAGNKDISGTVSVTDNNGCTDVASVTAKFYPSGLGAGSCTAQNNNNCYYNISCTGGSCTSGITKTYTCTANFKYHADPTDSGTPRFGESWMMTVSSQDEALTDTDESVSGVGLTSYISLDTTAAIQYGSLGIGEMANNATLVTSTVISATGNTGLDVELSGVNMTGAGTIAVGAQKYATSGVQYQNAIALTTTPTELELNLKKTTTTATLSTKAILWGLQIPADSPSGAYSGTNTISAKKAETADW